MSGQPLRWTDAITFFRAASQNPTITSHTKDYFHFIGQLSGQRTPRNTWGWKEPNTHLLLESFLNYFKNLRYIHIVRHGLDMAFSDNLNQLQNWGYRYGLALNGTENPEELAVYQLDLWIKSTRNILEIQPSHPDRIYLLHHDELCRNAEGEIKKMMTFCGLDTNDQIIKELSGIPKLPLSHHRYKEKDLSIFRPDQLNSVQELGFDI